MPLKLSSLVLAENKMLFPLLVGGAARARILAASQGSGALPQMPEREARRSLLLVIPVERFPSLATFSFQVSGRNYRGPLRAKSRLKLVCDEFRSVWHGSRSET